MRGQGINEGKYRASKIAEWDVERGTSRRFCPGLVKTRAVDWNWLESLRDVSWELESFQVRAQLSRLWNFSAEPGKVKRENGKREK